MRKTAKIIEFPSSKQERKKILEQNEDSRIRLVYRLRRVTGYLLVLAVLTFSVINYSLFNPENIRRIVSYMDLSHRAETEDLSTITFQSGSADSVIPFGNGLAISDKDSLYVGKPGGYTQLQMQLPYGNTVLRANHKYILAYDRGGTGYTVANNLAPLCQATLSSPIVSASIGDNGSVAVVSDETGYKGALTVYNVKQEQMYKWSSSEYYIMAAVLSPDSQHMASICFQQKGTVLVSKVIFFDLKKDSPTAEIALDNQLALDVKFLDNDTVCVVCDSGAYIVSSKGTVKKQQLYAPSELIAYDLSGDSLALATKSYRKSARADIVLIDSGGSVSPVLPVQAELRSLSYLNGTLGVLTSDKVILYSSKLAELYAKPDDFGSRRIMMRSDGNALLIGTKSAKIITPPAK